MRTFTFLCITFLLPIVVLSQTRLSDKASMRGYVKDLEIFSFSSANDLLQDRLIHNRLNFRYYPGKQINFGVELRNRIFSGETQRMVPDYSVLLDSDDGLIDMSFLIVDEPNFILLSQIDRAWVNWSDKKWSITLGRQRVNWGMNLFWNSNDIFNAYSLVDFDYEERPGTDAIRIQRFFGGMTSAEITVKPSEKVNEWVAAGLYRFNRWQYDFQFLAGNWYDDYVIGMGWAGNIRKAGFKGESTYFYPKKGNDDGVLSLSLSSDYVFKSGLFGTVGILYNSAGIDSSFSSGVNLFNESLSSKSLMPSKYSGLLNISYPFTPIVNGGVVLIYSPGVESVFAMPSFSYFIDDNLEVALFGQSFWMDTGNWVNIGNGVYLRIKGSF